MVDGSDVEKIKGIEKIIKRTGVLFGFLAGLSFALISWGVDGFLLFKASAFYPWDKLLLGCIPVIIIGVLVSWICVSFKNTLLNIFLWGLTGFGYAWIAVRIPFIGLRWLLGVRQFEHLGWLDYSLQQGIIDRGVFLIVIITAIAVIAGVFFQSLVEESANAGYIFKQVVPALLWMLAFSIMGLVVNSVISDPLRAPVQIVDDMIEFELGTLNLEMTPEVERQMQFSSLKKIRPLIRSERSLIVSSYDDQLVVVEVLVDFEDTLARCTVLNQQPGFCEQLE